MRTAVMIEDSVVGGGSDSLRRCASPRRVFVGAVWFLSVLVSVAAAPRAVANWVPARGTVDTRIRTAPYNADEVYRLFGYVGYQIDIEFERGERFVGLAAGDIDGIAFKAEGNHLFVKPRVSRVHTNLTVLTSRRQYEFEYSTLTGPPDPTVGEVIYALRFTYPTTPSKTQAVLAAKRISTALARAAADHPPNYDYWYCGKPDLKPLAAWDDGVRTWIRFGARSELPAIFVKNADGSESLVNFSVREGDIVVQRIAQRFVLRRGRLTGCIVNEAFSGAGARLNSHTVSPAVERVTQRPGGSAGDTP